MEPRGPTSHMATAMDPVHGNQSSFGSTDVTLTAQGGAVLMSSYGSESMGEVSKGTASTTFSGHRSQPVDAARQPLTVNDSGVSALSGGLGPPGPVISLGCHTWGYPHGCGNGAGPLDSPALPDPRSISIPGIPSLSGAQPSLSGVRPTPGFTGTPMGSGEFSGSGQSPAIRQAPPLHSE